MCAEEEEEEKVSEWPKGAFVLCYSGREAKREERHAIFIFLAASDTFLGDKILQKGRIYIMQQKYTVQYIECRFFMLFAG